MRVGRQFQPIRHARAGESGEALVAQSSEVVAPHGAIAANTLGLIQQVPVRPVHLTSGRTRKLKLGGSEVRVKHVPRWARAPPAPQSVP